MDNTVLAKSIFEAEDFQPLPEHRGDDVALKATIPEGAYAVLVLGLYHGLLIPDDFGPAACSTPVNPLAFDKVLVRVDDRRGPAGLAVESRHHRISTDGATRKTRSHEGVRNVKVSSAARLVPFKVSEEGDTR
jgi:hypothetical protein